MNRTSLPPGTAAAGELAAPPAAAVLLSPVIKLIGDICVGCWGEAVRLSEEEVTALAEATEPVLNKYLGPYLLSPEWALVVTVTIIVTGKYLAWQRAQKAKKTATTASIKVEDVIHFAPAAAPVHPADGAAGQT